MPKNLQELGQQAVLINKEEQLFEWEQSQYPTVQELMKECEPFAELFQSTYTWQVRRSFGLR